MTFDALETSLQLAAAMRGPLERLRTHDADLADQARRATTSVALNLGEGRQRAGKDRLHLFRVAAGSLTEVTTTLRIAEAWGYLDGESLTRSFALIDRLAAMLWRLTHPRR